MATKYIDFQELKTRVGIAEVIPMLSLPVKQKGDQWRGACPACASGGDRALVITESKAAFYCFAARKGGDVIALVAHIKGIGVREAAFEIAERFGTVSVPPAGNGTVPDGTVPQSAEGPREQGTRTLQPLAYLQGEHEFVQALGVEPDTAERYGSGYAPKGIMRGRYAVPIHTMTGQLVGYCGIAVKEDQQPRLLFPNGFQHTAFVFNAHNVEPGDFLYATREPLSAILASQNGVENVVAFFGEVTADALDALRLLMDERQIPAVEFM